MMKSKKPKPGKKCDELDERLAAWEERKAEIDRLAREAPSMAMSGIIGEELHAARLAWSTVVEYHGYSKFPGMSAVLGLLHHSREFLGDVEKLAKAGSPNALAWIWHMSARLCWLVDDVARTEPERLKELARDSLCMPSLRAIPHGFMSDWEKIARHLHLSENTVVNMRAGAQHELHSAATLFVARWLEKVTRTRRDVECFTAHWQRLQGNPDTDDAWYELREFRLDDFLREAGQFTERDLNYRTLPTLYNPRTWEEWWKKGLYPYIHSGDALEDIRGTRFYAELVNATDNGKDYELRDEMKRRCKGKLKSLAPPISDSLYKGASISRIVSIKPHTV